MLKRLLILPLLLALFCPYCSGQRSTLKADGNSKKTYSLLNSFLGGTAYEVPDCAHSTQHITQQTDPDLSAPFFAFHAHVKKDNDRCEKFDRQRTEIKTYNPSPAQFKGYQGERVGYSWDLKLDSNFQPSKAFTHLFQVTAVGGEDSSSLITITPRLKSDGKKILQIIHAGPGSRFNTIWEGDFAPFAGQWIHIVTEYECKLGGKFTIRIKQKDNNEQLMSYSNTLDMWRKGNSFLRPKWGIYRSLTNKKNLTDEIVYLNNFCLSKTSPLCS